MGLFQFLRQLLFGSPSNRSVAPSETGQPERRTQRSRAARKPRLKPFRYKSGDKAEIPETIEVSSPPHELARYGSRTGHYFDMTRDSDVEKLDRYNLPQFRTPLELSQWLDIPLGKLAWLTHRFNQFDRPDDVGDSHYAYHWLPKRNGFRLIEAPKPFLKIAQQQILQELLSKIPVHSTAHGFITGHSPVTNARPHVGKRVVVKFDLENFYTSVKFSRVVSIFRSVGYCREAAICLARLTTSAVPMSMPFPDGSVRPLYPYLSRHLPQGASTSPALANLSAFSLDVRLSGLARSFGADYTRYADDLTFSGSGQFLRSLRVFIPLVEQIIRSERFQVNHSKRRVLRNNQQQKVTGVVVNEHTNVPRKEFDLLKAILTNCIRSGPVSQNREQHPDFASHLRGRVAYVQQLNPNRGQRLLQLYERIRW
ncbi:MAG: reverse transcriptase family protein [Planctomycetes bacterium]|nr:reverse transcriptase family protein [Planctomycetota bacterium]MCH9724290.1 reverse transcriptase family protein [Planctomycetota bacterium]MCH9777309.1 reverse transcriptase family protein [Planctomycetota bacterium]MCH9792993.1 reverse transcriptase family protein [Planctomycetota bacterium]